MTHVPAVECKSRAARGAQVRERWVDTVIVTFPIRTVLTRWAVPAALLGLAGGAAAESQWATSPAGTHLSASAHVDFRIVIPPALGLAMDGADRASVFSNMRSVALGAGTPMTLHAAAHGVIRSDRRCAGPAGPRNVIVCTASMP